MIATGNARSLQGNNESVPAMSANVSLGRLVVFAILEIRVKLLAAECSGLYVTPVQCSQHIYPNCHRCLMFGYTLGLYPDCCCP